MHCYLIMVGRKPLFCIMSFHLETLQVCLFPFFRMVVRDGGEHFYASHVFREKQYRDAFSCSCFEDSELDVMLGWIRRTLGMFMKNKLRAMHDVFFCFKQF